MIALRAVDSHICETEKWGGALAAPERPIGAMTGRMLADE
jgi:hypothetical protein